MAIYNETATIDASLVLNKFKKFATMESALICHIKAKGKCTASGESIVEVVKAKQPC